MHRHTLFRFSSTGMMRTAAPDDTPLYLPGMTLASQWKSGFDDSEAETDHEAVEQGLQSPEHRKQVGGSGYPLSLLAPPTGNSFSNCNGGHGDRKFYGINFEHWLRYNEKLRMKNEQLMYNVFGPFSEDGDVIPGHPSLLSDWSLMSTYWCPAFSDVCACAQSVDQSIRVVYERKDPCCLV